VTTVASITEVGQECVVPTVVLELNVSDVNLLERSGDQLGENYYSIYRRF
jgi:hypothetical protein